MAIDVDVTLAVGFANRTWEEQDFTVHLQAPIPPAGAALEAQLLKLATENLEGVEGISFTQLSHYKLPETDRALSDAEKQRYLEAGGGYCPYCGDLGAELEYELADTDTTTASQKVECGTCHRHWWDEFVFTGIGEAVD